MKSRDLTARLDRLELQLHVMASKFSAARARREREQRKACQAADDQFHKEMGEAFESGDLEKVLTVWKHWKGKASTDLKNIWG